MADGTAAESGPGEITSVPPRHDAWVVGELSHLTGLRIRRGVATVGTGRQLRALIFGEYPADPLLPVVKHRLARDEAENSDCNEG
jgi:hypothetical protein